MRWYKRDPDAALSGMAGLTLEERGLYNAILDAYYARDGRLPDDDWLLSRIVACNPRTVRKVKLALFQKQKLTIEDGHLVPNRGHKTLNEARTFSELQSNASRMKAEEAENRNDNNAPPQPSTTTSTTTSTKKEDIATVAVATHRVSDEDFNEFWRSYPKRFGSNPKAPALKLFRAAVKSGADPPAIIAGARAYASDPATKVGTEFVCQAVKWLRDRRWEDYTARNTDTASELEQHRLACLTHNGAGNGGKQAQIRPYP